MREMHGIEGQQIAKATERHTTMTEARETAIEAARLMTSMAEGLRTAERRIAELESKEANPLEAEELKRLRAGADETLESLRILRDTAERAKERYDEAVKERGALN